MLSKTTVGLGRPPSDEVVRRVLTGDMAAPASALVKAMVGALRNAAGYRPYIACRRSEGEFTHLLIQALDTRLVAVKDTIADKIGRRICVIGGLTRRCEIWPYAIGYIGDIRPYLFYSWE